MAVRGISFDIPERQIVAMLGSNGASKTTMMKVLTGTWRQAKVLRQSEDTACCQNGCRRPRMPAALDNISILYRLTFVGTKC